MDNQDPAKTTISCSEHTTQRTTVCCGQYRIATVVTNESKVVEDWIENIHKEYQNQSNILVGFDAEWKPTFQKKTFNKAAIVQICIQSNCLIIQLQHLDILPDQLFNFFSDPKFIFCGSDIKNDTLRLKKEYEFRLRRVLDIAQEARQRWPDKLERYGLVNLAQTIGGMTDFKKSKKACLSNWEVKTLRMSQIVYACRDAFASYLVADRIRNCMPDKPDVHETVSQIGDPCKQWESSLSSNLSRTCKINQD